CLLRTAKTLPQTSRLLPAMYFNSVRRSTHSAKQPGLLLEFPILT
ncbi:MAG: hypothetical protein QOK33_4955, partial [Mycobacterium sp.]|nr:hypothetical protein [Mycobacterium sp.]